MFRLLILTLLLLLTTNTWAQPKALPVEVATTGVLFRVQAPDAKEVYLAGTFNGWGGSDGFTLRDPSVKMFGPDEKGVFERFQPLTPGRHLFKFCVDGSNWISGPDELPKAKDNFDIQEGQQGVPSTALDFAMTEPPWPSYVPTKEMMPVCVTHKETGQPYLRVRFFVREAESVHVVGSWDGWQGISGRSVNSEKHLIKRVAADPNFWESHIGPLQEGPLEYKIVVNNRIWLSDPAVLEQSDDGNTRITIAKHQGAWFALYKPSFSPDARRKATQSRWGEKLFWYDDRAQAFLRAQATKQKMLWVITLPKSRLSEQMMKDLNSDPEMVETLKGIITLETPAHDVDQVLKQQKIFRLPHIILVDSKYQPVWQGFNPSLDKLKAQIQKLE
jgi:hypothetical protein